MQTCCVKFWNQNNMKFLKQKFFCFSSQVMLGTFLTEVTLAIYVWLRFKASPLTRLCVVILLALAAFQLAEYNICANQTPLLWAKIGFAATALLPTLGLHLVKIITKSKQRLWLANAVTTLFIAEFILVPGAITSAQCGGNYNLFTISPRLDILFAVYYPVFLAIALVWAFRLLKTAPKPQKRILRWAIIGYLSFIVPTFVIYVLNTTTRAGIASIMCGFAVILAFILSFKIVSLAARNK